MTRLTTHRLILRAAQDTDLAPLFAIYSDARAMRYWSYPPLAALEDIKPLFQELKRPGPRQYFVIEYQGCAVGTCGIHESTEIGFILHPDHWRKGITSEAARAVIQHMWDTTDVSHITADIDPRNTASAGILTHLGFRQTGTAERTFCVAGEWSDSAYFALDRPSG